MGEDGSDYDCKAKLLENSRTSPMGEPLLHVVCGWIIKECGDEDEELKIFNSCFGSI